MRGHRVEFAPAFLLSQRAYRETSLLVEAFSAEHGRVGLVARGARGPKARLRGLLQPFRRLLLSWTDSGELGSLAAAESAPGEVAPTLDGERIFHGWYVNELLLKLLQRHDPHPELFADYATTLSRLATEADGEPALRGFEKRLLAALGYALPLDSPWDPQRRYRFDVEAGTLADDDPAAEAVAGSSLIALRDDRYADRSSLRDARRLLRLALERQLGGRPLETPRLLRQMRAHAAAAAPPPPGDR